MLWTHSMGRLANAASQTGLRKIQTNGLGEFSHHELLSSWCENSPPPLFCLKKKKEKKVTSTAEFENRKIRSPWVFMHFWWQFKVAPVGNVLALEHWHVFLTSDVAAWSRPTPSASWCWTLTLLVSHSRNKRLLCSAANHLPCLW